ncbi:MAG: hypothetical protein ABI051_14190 [Vicinamibacterales bacterium]
MDKRHLAVATITWARDVREEARLLKSVRELTSTTRRVFVTDGGSPDSLIEGLRTLKRVDVAILGEPRGLVFQVQASINRAAASGAEFILYTEPDKYEFFRDHLDDFLDRAPADPDLGIVLASRSLASFETFPSAQQETERIFNRLCGNVLGEQLDYTYGPFLMRRSLVPIVAHMARDLGWGWRPYIFACAHRRGLRIGSVSGDYSCPAEERLESDSAHRLAQLDQNVDGLVRSAGVSDTAR